MYLFILFSLVSPRSSFHPWILPTYNLFHRFTRSLLEFRIDNTKLDRLITASLEDILFFKSATKLTFSAGHLSLLKEGEKKNKDHSP